MATNVEPEKDIKQSKKERKSGLSLNWKSIATVIALIAWVGIASIATQLIIGYPLLQIIGKQAMSSPLWTTIYSAITYAADLAIIILIPKAIKKKWGTTREELGLKDLPTFTDIGIAFIGFIATMIISSVVVDGLLKNVINTEQVQDVGFNNLINPSDRILAFIALVIIAPIAEEIIFRGWLYDKIKKYSGTTIAIVLVSVLFGALHGQWNVGITVGIMSAIMCIERELTGTIYAGIITHMIKNGLAFWLIYIVTGYF